MNFLSYYDTYLIFIISIKILFLISAVELFYYSHFSKSSDSLAKSAQFELWKQRTEFVFILSMTIYYYIYFIPEKFLLLLIVKQIYYYLFMDVFY